MHYQPNVDFAFNSIEHIMRDVNNGWILRYIHANVASFFFIFVYMHVGRGLYYSSYKSPRILVWSIGVIILILMMANIWPNCDYDNMNVIYNYCLIGKMLPFHKVRTKALKRIGPHNKLILDIIICGMLGDF
jgi:Cytochrome b/b6/petB